LTRSRTKITIVRQNESQNSAFATCGWAFAAVIGTPVMLRLVSWVLMRVFHPGELDDEIWWLFSWLLSLVVGFVGGFIALLYLWRFRPNPKRYALVLGVLFAITCLLLGSPGKSGYGE
jgi:uncharacterized BrkB/YihY/UPF0761 family membrane protein